MVSIPERKVVMFVAASEKIFDIQEPDVGMHVCSIASKIPPNTVAIIVNVSRAGGSGYLNLYSNEGTLPIFTSEKPTVTLAISNQRIKWSQSVSSDDFDLHMFGYFVEGPVGK